MSWCDASQSVGARTLRPPTEQDTFLAVGDRISSHDPRQRSATPSRDPPLKLSELTVQGRHVITVCEMTVFFLVCWQFCRPEIDITFTSFSDYVTLVFGYVDFIAVILRSRKLCSVNFWIYLTCRCRTFAII